MEGRRSDPYMLIDAGFLLILPEICLNWRVKSKKEEKQGCETMDSEHELSILILTLRSGSFMNPSPLAFLLYNLRMTEPGTAFFQLFYTRFLYQVLSGYRSLLDGARGGPLVEASSFLFPSSFWLHQAFICLFLVLRSKTYFAIKQTEYTSLRWVVTLGSSIKDFKSFC